MNRDPALIAQIKTPVFIASQSSKGLTTEQIKRAQEEHSRKLMGWKYHQLSKAREDKIKDKRDKNTHK